MSSDRITRTAAIARSAGSRIGRAARPSAASGSRPARGCPPLVQLAWIWLRPTSAMLRLRRYGKRATIALPFQLPLVALSDPADIREVADGGPGGPAPRRGLVRMLEPLLGRHSVILLDEDAHLEQRRLLLPAFHGERMQALAGLMEELTESRARGLADRRALALHPRLQRLTLEIILRAVFGLERGARLDQLRESMGNCSSSPRPDVDHCRPSIASAAGSRSCAAFQPREGARPTS